VTNAAVDNDIPALPLTYTVLVTNLLNNSAVLNAAISTNGVITWTPTEAQGPSTNLVTTVVSDGTLSATNRFTAVINEVNSAPVLPVQGNLIITGRTPVLVTNTATDGDLPANPLGYQLVSPPSGAVINTDGIISWTPSVKQVPGVYTFTTVVTDTNIYAVNAQNLSATNSFTVTVQVSHNGPTLPAASNVTNNELLLLTVTNSAVDNDIPALALTYTVLVTNLLNNSAVLNATISTNGVITWTPSEAQGPSTNLVTTVVSDGTLSATNRFTAVINEVNTAPVLPVQGNLISSGLTPVLVTNTATDSDIPANPLGYQLTGPSGAVISTNGVISWTPGVGQVPGVYTFTTIVTDTNIYAVNAKSLSVTNHFQITVNVASNDFRILSITITNRVSTVIWTSVAGNYYRLLYKDSLLATNWNSVIPDAMATNQTTSMTNVLGGATQRFYTVMLVQTTDLTRPIIQSIGITNGVATLTWSAVPPHVYRLQYNGDLSSSIWNNVVPDVTATGQNAVMTNAFGNATMRFYRVFIVQ
jgi:hypothetical protein